MAQDAHLKTLNTKVGQLVDEVDQRITNFMQRNNFEGALEGYSSKFAAQLATITEAIDQMMVQFSITKVRADVERQMELRMEEIRKALSAELMLKVERVVGESYHKARNDKDGDARARKPDPEAESSLNQAMRAELRRLLERQQMIEVRVEDYKDELLDRLSLGRSVESLNTAATFAPVPIERIYTQNPLTLSEAPM